MIMIINGDDSRRGVFPDLSPLQLHTAPIIMTAPLVDQLLAARLLSNNSPRSIPTTTDDRWPPKRSQDRRIS